MGELASYYYNSTPSKYSQLERLFGDAVSDIKQAFLTLNNKSLDALFKQYSALYGEAAGKYARQTSPKWRSGATRLSGRTMERLIELVPPYLSAEQRFKLLQQVLLTRTANT